MKCLLKDSQWTLFAQEVLINDKPWGLREKFLYRPVNRFFIFILRAIFCFPLSSSFSLYMSVVSSLWSLIWIWQECGQDGRGEDFWRKERCHREWYGWPCKRHFTILVEVQHLNKKMHSIIWSHSLIYIVRAVNNRALYISLVCTWIIAQGKENVYTFYELLMGSKSVNALRLYSISLKQRSDAVDPTLKS